MARRCQWGYGSGHPIGQHLRRLKLPPRSSLPWVDVSPPKVTHGWQVYCCDPHGRSRLVLYYHRRLGGPPAKHKWPAWAVGHWERKGGDGWTGPF